MMTSNHPAADYLDEQLTLSGFDELTIEEMCQAVFDQAAQHSAKAIVDLYRATDRIHNQRLEYTR